jgi:hypothetical protein
MTVTDPADSAMSRARKYTTNLFIVCFVGVMIIDAVPAVSPTLGTAKQILDPILDATGLWQDSWQLFAPSPKSLNIFVTARIEFDDGSSYDWRSPNWRQLSLGEKFRLVRHTKFYENLRLDSYSEVWPAFADYRVSQLPEPLRGKKVRRVELVRHWMTIPKPTSLWHSLPTDFRPDRRYLFYSKEYR